MFKVRTSAPEKGNPYYSWGVESEGQCTWGVYGRVKECGFTPCVWYDRATQSGSYTNAKLWLENYRDPWEVKGANYKPVAGDVAVFDGQYGHVVFIERMDGDVALISDWNRVAPLTYSSDTWDVTKPLSRCGNLMGYLHFPFNSVNPVARNENVNQIQTTDDQLRIRTKPSLDGEIVGHVQIGYYNVLSQKEANDVDKEKVSGLSCWYEIVKDRWCANITTKFYPANKEDDFIQKIEEYFNGMKEEIEKLQDENEKYLKKLKLIHDESNV